MSVSPPIGHMAISASAGSGKTFQLAHRYIALLLHGVSPERICALTFSRKAAGEIYESIVEYLCNAASSDACAAETAGLIGIKSATRETFLSCLAQYLHHLHRNHIGTLDSFIISILRAFPAELGVAVDFNVTAGDGAEAREMRRCVLDRIFKSHAVAPEVQAEFLEAFKQATFGREEKTIENTLERFICDYRGRFQSVPDASQWGEPSMIWPAGGAQWCDHEPGVKQAVAGLREAIRGADDDSPRAQRWEEFADALERHSAGTPLPRREMDHLEKLLDAFDDLETGRATIVVNRKKNELSRELCGACVDCVRAFMAQELNAALVQTRGIHRVLKAHEHAYQRISRLTGELTFEDAQFVLSPDGFGSTGLAASRDPGRDGRLYIDYRMDATLDHWLLDEFQDTSDLQWSTLQNLADEVLQDTGGNRTFFYVGDVKQAIYAWRGGNPRLFRRILDQYGSAIEQIPLSKSFRSGPAVIDTVNAVFGSVGDAGLPPGAVSAWEREWLEHECAAHNLCLDGYTALIEPARAGSDDSPTDDDRYRVVADLVNEIDPIGRGLSIAVLVRRNDAGRAIVDVLRASCADVPVVHEGESTIVDNPASATLLALLRFATHPGDSLAWGHVWMSPLRHYFQSEDIGRNRVPNLVLKGAQADGYSAFVRTWRKRLARHSKLDEFACVRLDDLEEAALEFDATGNRDTDAFLRFMEHYTVREEALGEAVRVMTVHQSKGLGFDVVILPDLMGRGMVSGGQAGVLVHRDSSSQRPKWALRMPRRAVAEHDNVLAEALRVYDDDACFEALCLLYVSLTRARRAVYMVTSFPGKSSKALNAAAFLKHQLGAAADAAPESTWKFGRGAVDVLYETGTRRWHEPLPRPASPPPEPAIKFVAAFKRRKPRRRRLGRLLPSSSDEHAWNAGRLFTVETREVLDFGRAIHFLFEQVEWVEDTDLDAILETYLPRIDVDEAVKRDVVVQFREAMASVQVRAALARPGPNGILWREQRFDIVLDGNLVTGVFDRVTIQNDEHGRPQAAEIVDYKSNRIDTEEEIAAAAETYHGQLSLYRRALARIIQLSEEAIACRLIFTRPGVSRIVAQEPAAT